MLGNGLVDLLVDGQQSLAGAPVHLADELTTEGVDDTGDRGSLALADEVKVKHSLDGTGLETVDEASSLVGEESVLWKGAEGSARGSETLDVVVGRQLALGAVGTVGRGLNHFVGRGREIGRDGRKKLRRVGGGRQELEALLFCTMGFVELAAGTRKKKEEGSRKQG